MYANPNNVIFQAEHSGDKATPAALNTRELAETARETHWRFPGFIKAMFEGVLRLDLIEPFPQQDVEEQRRAQHLFAQLEQFLQDEVDSEAIDRDGEIPPEVIAGLGKLGALGIKIPQQFGGLGLSQTSLGKAIALVASQDGSLAELLPAAQSIGLPMPLMLFGTPEQQQKFLPPLARGAISAFALTEPGAGSDPGAMQTTAVLDKSGAHYVLNGEKLWISNGTIAEFMVVMARTGDRHTAFIVEMHWPGITVSQRLRFMGLRGMENGSIRFNDVKVPVANVLWGEGLGLKLALITLNIGRLSLPAGCVGVAKRCLAIARRWAGERRQWGRPIGEHDAIAQKLGQMAADVFAMDSVSDLASGLADRGDRDIRLEAAVAKLWNSETGWRIVDDTVQIKGGRGYETAASLQARGERPDPVERMLRDFRINRIFEGTSEIMHLFVAREAVDMHMKLTRTFFNRKASTMDRMRCLGRMMLFYLQWYPRLYFPAPLPGNTNDTTVLSRHLRFVERSARKLARTLFHCMLRHGLRLEHRQALLGRLVDIAAELFAICAVCVRVKAMQAGGTPSEEAVALADLFSCQARHRIETLFGAIRRNVDVATYTVAQRVLKNQYLWLEEGIVRDKSEIASVPVSSNGS